MSTKKFSPSFAILYQLKNSCKWRFMWELVLMDATPKVEIHWKYNFLRNWCNVFDVPYFVLNPITPKTKRIWQVLKDITLSGSLTLNVICLLAYIVGIWKNSIFELSSVVVNFAWNQRNNIDRPADAPGVKIQIITSGFNRWDREVAGHLFVAVALSQWKWYVVIFIP